VNQQRVLMAPLTSLSLHRVFTGLWRLGQSAPARVIGTTPDISVLAKILTGGLVPMALTLASRSIFDTFARSEQKVDALLHGHSYTAHPVGCEVAAEALRRISRLDKTDETWSAARQDWNAPQAAAGEEAKGKIAPWSFWQQSVVERLSRSDAIASAMAMGTVLVVNLRDSNGGG
jgi:dethiobiotin synthetase/adenosylmethionine--8-amino-7-oxononanoate aminotransferase